MDLYLHHINSTLLLSTVALCLTILSYLCKNLVFCGNLINIFLSWFKYKLPEDNTSCTNNRLLKGGSCSLAKSPGLKGFSIGEKISVTKKPLASNQKPFFKSFVDNKEEDLTQVVIQSPSPSVSAANRKPVLDLEKLRG